MMKRFPNACKDQQGRLRVGAAIGVFDLDRAESLIAKDVDVLVVDSPVGPGVSVLKSGVHATIAGVLIAFTIPLKHPEGKEHSPLRNLEHDLHPTVAFFILPLFAFANTGIPLEGMNMKTLMQPEPFGIAMGLFLGKQLGVFGFTWAAVKSGIAKLPSNVGWPEMYGLSVLTGIGFTMSLFISSLAFEEGATNLNADRLGILAGSFASAFVGMVVLYFALRNKEPIKEDKAIEENGA